MDYYHATGPVYGKQFIFYVCLYDQLNTKLHKVNPTIAAGDFQVSKDGGSFANLTTLPAVTPASGAAVKITLSATEMQANNIVVRWSDVSGAEWCDGNICVQTSPGAYEFGVIDDATFTPTTTAFETDLTEATADHYNGRSIIFVSGALKGQATAIEDYVLANSKGKFTVTALTEAPADSDIFMIV